MENHFCYYSHCCSPSAVVVAAIVALVAAVAASVALVHAVSPATSQSPSEHCPTPSALSHAHLPTPRFACSTAQCAPSLVPVPSPFVSPTLAYASLLARPTVSPLVSAALGVVCSPVGTIGAFGPVLSV